MERTTILNDIKELKNISTIGHKEQKYLLEELGAEIELTDYPEIPFTIDELSALKGDYILLFAHSSKTSRLPINIKTFIQAFGYLPTKDKPNFYNQDWYNNETFLEEELLNGWYLIKKEIIPSTIATNPLDILDRNLGIKFPSAALCIYAFFANYYYTGGELLWKDSFIWCSDNDVNGDRIYVGKYDNSLNLNNDGFSIHRHLSITKNYAAIDCR